MWRTPAGGRVEHSFTCRRISIPVPTLLNVVDDSDKTVVRPSKNLYGILIVHKSTTRAEGFKHTARANSSHIRLLLSHTCGYCHVLFFTLFFIFFISDRCCSIRTSTLDSSRSFLFASVRRNLSVEIPLAINIEFQFRSDDWNSLSGVVEKGDSHHNHADFMYCFSIDWDWNDRSLSIRRLNELKVNTCSIKTLWYTIQGLLTYTYCNTDVFPLKMLCSPTSSPTFICNFTLRILQKYYSNMILQIGWIFPASWKRTDPILESPYCKGGFVRGCGKFTRLKPEYYI